MKDLTGSTFVFIGRSGCGKGTQAALLENFLKEQGYDVLKVTTGDLGRKLARENTPVGELVKKLLDEGKLFPGWLAISINMHAIMNALTSNERIVIVDGAPRRLFEAEALDQLMNDVGRPAIIPIHLDISEDEVRERLQKRGRNDDKEGQDIEVRLGWFKTDVMPALEYYGKRLVTFNGAGDIQEIHTRIINSLTARI